MREKRASILPGHSRTPHTTYEKHKHEREKKK